MEHENSENRNFLHFYMEALECYRNLEAALYQSTVDHATILPSLQTCLHQIRYLMHLETNNGIVHIFLFQLCEQIKQQIEYIKTQNVTKSRQEHFAIPPKKSTNELICKRKLSASLKPQNATKTSSSFCEESTKINELLKNTEVTLRVKGLADVAGLQQIKKELSVMVLLPIHQPQLFTAQQTCNLLLLFGPPGTGKTQLVHALAAEASVSLYSVTASDVLGQYVGQSEKMIRAVFQFVKENNKRSILFIDEIDGFCRRRSDSENDFNRRLKTELMCQLSDFERCTNAILICVTNFPWELDTAFIRRFQRRLYIPLPNRLERLELFKLHTKNTRLELTSTAWNSLLDVTDGFSGSDIANLVRNAVHNPIIELSNIFRWKLLESGMYQPASNTTFEYDSNILYSDLQDLPPQSVMARDVKLEDLLSAANVIKKTVTEEEVKKYECYVENCV